MYRNMATFSLRPNKKIPLFPVSRPSLIFTPTLTLFTYLSQSEETWEKNVMQKCVLQEFGQYLHNKEGN